MTTYVYESIPTVEGGETTFHEIRQSMAEDALTTHPVTGEPIRRVILGGYGIMQKGSASSGGESCGTGCGCC
ncbi:MAG: zinc ribbon domain-containing protein [Terrimicrobiaceae bacterium]|jgi:predicted nucleic acid-binding Zn ribbon protein